MHTRYASSRGDQRGWTSRFIPRTNDPWRNLKLAKSWGGVTIVSPNTGSTKQRAASARKAKGD